MISWWVDKLFDWLTDWFSYDKPTDRLPPSGGFRDCGAWDRNHLRGPCLKIFCWPRLFFKFFSLKFLCLIGVFKCFPVIFFNFFSGAGPLLGYRKCGAWGHGPLGTPLKPPLLPPIGWPSDWMYDRLTN